MERRLVIGTSNEAKFRQIASTIEASGLRAVRLADLGHEAPDATETGNSAAEVAENKAGAYYAALRESVLAMDYWLHLDGVAGHEQPGAHVRRIPGHPGGADDDTLLEYYRRLVARHGGLITGHWTLGVAVAGPAGVRSTTRTGRPRNFVATPSLRRLPGLPISSLQMDPATGRYISEQPPDEEERLWREVYGVGLAEFARTAVESVHAV